MKNSNRCGGMIVYHHTVPGTSAGHHICSKCGMKSGSDLGTKCSRIEEDDQCPDNTPEEREQELNDMDGW